MYTKMRSAALALGLACALGLMLWSPGLTVGQTPSPAPLPVTPPSKRGIMPEPSEPNLPVKRSGTSAPVASGQCTLILEGSKQGRFKGEGTKDNNREYIIGLNYDAEFRQEAPKGATAREPILITKTMGAASPQIYSAQQSGETMKTAVLEFYQGASASAVESFYTMKLSGARIVSVRQFVEGGVFYEQIGLTFESAEVEHKSTRK
jgi:type VI secretion system Hcp family effector